MDRIIGNYLASNYTYFNSSRKVTMYNCPFTITLETLQKVELARPNLTVSTLETLLRAFTILWGNVGYAVNDQPAPTVVVATGGSMTEGDHYYYVSFVYGSSETLVDSISLVATTDGTSKTVNLSEIPLGATGCTARKIYKKTGVGGSWYLRGTLSDNTTTIYSDTVVDNTTTSAPTTSTAYDFIWSATLDSIATPITQVADKFKIIVDITDNTESQELGYKSVAEINPIHGQTDSSMIISASQAFTTSWVISGSSFSSNGRNLVKGAAYFVPASLITASLMFVYKKQNDSLYYPLTVTFDRQSRFITGIDSSTGFTIYTFSSMVNQYFSFELDIAGTYEIEIRQIGTGTVTSSALSIDIIKTWNGYKTQCLPVPFDFGLEVQRNNIPGVTGVIKFGAAPSGIQTTISDIWSRCDSTPTQQIWLPPTTNRIHAIVSDSVTDVAGSTGATSITLYGLKSWSASESSETIILNGTTPVNTVDSYVIIHRMIANGQATTTSVGINTGTITATASTDSTITAVILPNEGQTEMTIYGIPSTKTLYINRWACNIDKSGATVSTCDFELRVNPNPDIQRLGYLRKSDISLQSDGTTQFSKSFDPPLAIKGPAIIKIQAISSSNDLDAESEFTGYLVNN